MQNILQWRCAEFVRVLVCSVQEDSLGLGTPAVAYLNYVPCRRTPCHLRVPALLWMLNTVPLAHSLILVLMTGMPGMLLQDLDEDWRLHSPDLLFGQSAARSIQADMAASEEAAQSQQLQQQLPLGGQNAGKFKLPCLPIALCGRAMRTWVSPCS